MNLLDLETARKKMNSVFDVILGEWLVQHLVWAPVVTSQPLDPPYVRWINARLNDGREIDMRLWITQTGERTTIGIDGTGDGYDRAYAIARERLPEDLKRILS